MQETEAVKEAAKLIGIAIRTAPKSAGVDDISYTIVSDSEKAASADEIRKIAAFLIKENREAKTKKAIELDWHSDAEVIDKSDCLILLGVKGRKPLGFNCGGCGFKGCQEFMSAKSPETIFMAGPFCMFKLLDLGIAVSSAAKAAAHFNIDNRIMYRAGLAGYKLALLKECNPVIGIPLSASGKNIYFDRKEKVEAKELWRQINSSLLSK
ncbi:MAG: hypothetical protein A2Y00_10595 [Omnitrophica WOR_2 bacterium GWF2_43_52]|nr:MAG: hypothetical protein A2062_04325 [Omnitrophica WOR_2 bacterium GWA2_44_7]OGX20743.1 MAG: hypothetical protein A2Y00_10595 [Omnitrophica WOR_2 bacterium GWF2_43_52]HAH19764.1 hypothetical protein [Candidatus Omnitrophota bacterium]HBG63389.1 hypothetical protein [Candidatus Omnitrophota bacterium]